MLHLLYISNKLCFSRLVWRINVFINSCIFKLTHSSCHRRRQVSGGHRRQRDRSFQRRVNGKDRPVRQRRISRYTTCILSCHCYTSSALAILCFQNPGAAHVLASLGNNFTLKWLHVERLDSVILTVSIVYSTFQAETWRQKTDTVNMTGSNLSTCSHLSVKTFRKSRV